MDLSGVRAVYLYDGSFEGLLSAIFEVWHIPMESFENIKAEQNNTPSFHDKNIQVETDPDKTVRVRQWIREKLPQDTEERIYEYFLSEDPGRERRIYFYLRACNRLGKWVDSYLTDPAVADFLKTEKRFRNELHRMCGFTRFKLLEENVLFSEIVTDYNQLAGLGSFFLDRMPGQRFIIYDSRRNKAVLSNGRKLALLDRFRVDSLKEETSGDHFEQLWKGYLQALTIEERRNYKLQRQTLPMKYRKCMTEFQ